MPVFSKPRQLLFSIPPPETAPGARTWPRPNELLVTSARWESRLTLASNFDLELERAGLRCSLRWRGQCHFMCSPREHPLDEEDLLAELPGTSLCHPCCSLLFTISSIGQLHEKLHGWTNKRPRRNGTVPRTPDLSIAKLSSDAAVPNRGGQQVRGKASPANVQIRGRPRPDGARPEEVVQSQGRCRGSAYDSCHQNHVR